MLGAIWSLALFVALSAGMVYVWFTAVQGIDEAEYGGTWELTKEGFLNCDRRHVRTRVSTSCIVTQ